MTAWAPWQVSVLTAGLVSRPPVAHGPADWPEVRDWVWAHRLTGLLRQAVVLGAVTLTVRQQDELDELHDRAMVHDLRLERLLLRTVAAFADHGITAAVSKGPAVAHLDYPTPDLRSFSDIDLFVRSGDIDAASAALATAGLTRLQPEPRPGFDRRYAKGSTWTDDRGLEVDIHRTLVSGPFGTRIDEALLWRQPDTFTLGGQSLVALSRPVRALVAAFQLSLDTTYLRAAAARDFLSILGALDSERELVDLAEACHAGAVLADAVTRLGDLLGRDLDPRLTPWARARPASTQERRWLRAYRRPGRTYADLSILAMLSLPRLRDRARMGAALAWPRPSYLAGRYTSRRSRWRRAATVAMRRGPHGG